MCSIWADILLDWVANHSYWGPSRSDLVDDREELIVIISRTIWMGIKSQWVTVCPRGSTQTKSKGSKFGRSGAPTTESGGDDGGAAEGSG